MMVTGTTRVFLVVGDPVTQVVAPRLFNAVFQQCALDAVLVPAQVSAADFEPFVRQVLRAPNIGGLWITIPHKPASARLVDSCTRLASLAGSVNAIRREADGRLGGALFDGEGFVKAVRHFGFTTLGRSALVVGAGGAGAAIAASLLEAGVSQLALHDLGDQASALAARLRADSSCPVQVLDRPDPSGFDLVVNATPLGLNPSDPLPFEVAALSPGALVVDILMKREPTPLLEACGARGVRALPGFEMLIQQVPEYLAYFGFDEAAASLAADLEPVRRLIEMP